MLELGDIVGRRVFLKKGRITTRVPHLSRANRVLSQNVRVRGRGRTRRNHMLESCVGNLANVIGVDITEIGKRARLFAEEISKELGNPVVLAFRVVLGLEDAEPLGEGKILYEHYVLGPGARESQVAGEIFHEGAAAELVGRHDGLTGPVVLQSLL